MESVPGAIAQSAITADVGINIDTVVSTQPFTSWAESVNQLFEIKSLHLIAVHDDFIQLRCDVVNRQTKQVITGMAAGIVSGIPFTSAAGISTETFAAAVTCRQFKDWFSGIDQRFKIKSLNIQSVDMFGKTRIGFIKFDCDVVDRASGKFLPGIVFMRGGAVGMLVIFNCKGKKFAVLTKQPRLATGSFEFLEIPAGMLDGSDDFGGVAAKEIFEELGMTINKKDLRDLTAAAGYPGGFYPSPGGCEETIRLFCLEKEVTEAEMADIEGKCTGELEEGEQIVLTVKPLDDLWQVPDGKTHSAYLLYTKLEQPQLTDDLIITGDEIRALQAALRKTPVLRQLLASLAA